MCVPWSEHMISRRPPSRPLNCENADQVRSTFETGS
ncbi:hypothetical protein GZL_01564 [Streptomyces sp. 769]|nr:hypothetical protein GZL_01564 [Streptomyces sp. 769]